MPDEVLLAGVVIAIDFDDVVHDAALAAAAEIDMGNPDDDVDGFADEVGFNPPTNPGLPGRGF